MTRPPAGPATIHQDAGEISIISLASVLLRWRRLIVAPALIGLVAGVTIGLTSPRRYVSSATFLPQVSEASSSGLALVASQFGIRMPMATGGGWGPPIYVELLRSRALLEPIALDSIVVAEQGGRRVALIDLLEIEAPTPERRVDRAVRALGKIVESREVRSLNAVTMTVTTKWPSVSLALAERLVRGVNQFNLETRKSQAAAERQFVEVQAGEAERVLREAEDRLQSFLQRNRTIASAQLEFERDRLQREVLLRQQVYTSLLQNREEARIREVRDTPVITVLESPRLPAVSESRKSVQKGALGGVAGGFLGILIALVAHAVFGARRAPSEEEREFFQLVEEATPTFLKRRIH